MNEDQIQALLDAMTLEEQVSLLAGASFWTTVPIERLEIPAIKVSDGPNGARGGGALTGGVPAACFPAGISLASTWNTALVEQVGGALAEEAQSKGARVLLAPTVNLHRSTLNGRNFECYSEDPFLTAMMGVAYINGVQNKGVSATIKHYVGNESEFERMTISSEIDERSLRELYLLPFEAAVKDANVHAVMAAYNKVNGVYASQNPHLLIDILRKEWGFDGLVMSDWFATHSTVEGANAGLDLEMPGPTRYRGEKLVAAVHAGEVSEQTVRERARNVLRLIAWVGAFENPAIPEEQAIDRPEHRALIRWAGAEGTVLLKNEGILPLDKQKISKLAIIGPNAKTAQIMGGGSAQVNAHYRVTPFDGIAAQASEGVEIGYAAGCPNYKLLPAMHQKFTVEYFDSLDLSGAVVARAETVASEQMWFGEVAPGVQPLKFSARFTTRFTPGESGEYEVGLVSAGRSRLLVNGRLVVNNWDAWEAGDSFFGMGSKEVVSTVQFQANETYEMVIEFACHGDSPMGIRAVRMGLAPVPGDEGIERAVRLAAASDVAILCVGLNHEWDTEGNDRPHMDLAGRQNELIERVAAANPRTVVVLQTGAPVTMPWLDHVAAVVQAWYPGQECGNAIADVLFGAVNPSGRLPQTFPARLEDNPAFGNYPGENGKVQYGEGIFIGYRHYDEREITPLFPFGHGLSYTTFRIDNLQLSADSIEPGDELAVGLDVTNTGTRAGQEVVQLYIRDEQAGVARPPKELKGFAKVALEPGETAHVMLTLDMRALAYYDETRASWVAEAGSFEALVGSSSRDIHARAPFRLSADWVQPVGKG